MNATATAADLVEKQCNKCRDYWPADTEFFYRRAKAADGLCDCCKACYSEMPSVQQRNQRNQHNARGIISAWEALFESPVQEVHS